ncbi:MAG: baseplate J/gp47 family protein [bacterium]
MAAKFTFNITDMNYDSLIAAAKALAETHFPDWEFDNENDLGKFALDLYLHALDKALWLVNAWSGEWNILTARERKFVEARALALGYPIKTLVASIGTISVQFDSNPNPRTVGQFEIQASVLGADGEMIYYENSESFTIPSLIENMTIAVVEGRSISQTLVGTGRPYQATMITDRNVINGSVRVKVGGVSWTKVSSFTESISTSKHFIVEYLGDSFSRVVFGDGIYGAMPGLNAKILIDSRIGGGTRGNIAAADKVQTVENSPYAVVIVASSSMAGGQDLEAIDKIRLLAPRLRRAYDRVVNIEDIDAAVNAIEGVERCLVSLVSKTVVVRIIPAGGGDPSSALLNSVFEYLYSRILLGYTLSVIAPSYRPVDIVVTGIARPGLVGSEVQASLTADLLRRLNPTVQNVDYIVEFGVSLTLTDIMDVITNNGSLLAGFVVTSPVETVAVGDTEILTNIGSSVTINLV